MRLYVHMYVGTYVCMYICMHLLVNMYGRVTLHENQPKLAIVR